MQPKKSITEQLKESFLRDFNNNKKQREAEEKQKPFKTLESTKLILVNVCLS
jgi:hypothetical protein